MKIKILATVFVALSAAGVANANNAESFYVKAVALEKKGMAAMFSKDLKPVMNEFQSAAKAVKAENDAAKAAGKPIYCAPAKPQKMSASQLLGEFGKIPQARRQQLTVRQAWREILIRRYPC
jgi:hypothetical protein